MSEDFDPYRKWLGIPPDEQPPHHYRLLGIASFEDDPDVIENAANRQMAHIRTFQTGRHAQVSQRILNELAAAKICLLDVSKKAGYDAKLRVRLRESDKIGGAAPPPPRQVADASRAAAPPAASGRSIEKPPRNVADSGPVVSRLAPVRGRSAVSKLRARRRISLVPVVLGIMGVVGVGILFGVVALVASRH